MKLICSKCGMVVESLIIDKELAYKEVFNTHVKHVQSRHNAMFLEMQKAVGMGVAALTTFMHFNEFCVVPEDQIRLLTAVEQAQELVMGCLGYDIEEEDMVTDDKEGEEILEAEKSPQSPAD